jgi:hypothetical protein
VYVLQQVDGKKKKKKKTRKSNHKVDGCSRSNLLSFSGPLLWKAVNRIWLIGDFLSLFDESLVAWVCCHSIRK